MNFELFKPRFQIFQNLEIHCAGGHLRYPRAVRLTAGGRLRRPPALRITAGGQVMWPASVEFPYI
jgi:hypothetical protein